MESMEIEESDPSKNFTFFNKIRGARKLAIIIMSVLCFLAVLVPIIKNSWSSSSGPLKDDDQPAMAFPESSKSPHPAAAAIVPIIKQACTNTLYPSLCLDSFSLIPPSEKNIMNFHEYLGFMIKQTKKPVAVARSKIMGHLENNQDFSFHQKNALWDCVEMLDQTLYELGEAIDDLQEFPSSFGRYYRSYGNLKTLLSAAMTNENTCIDGFSNLQEFDSEVQNIGIKHQFQNLLTPISRMISNCLAMIKNIENINHRESQQNPRTMISRVKEDGLLDWMRIKDRKLISKSAEIIPDVIVSINGRGNHTMINKAIAMARNKSATRYVIKISSGIYKENVMIPREKINIMLIGDGMNSTIIEGSRNMFEGYSPFASATLTVIGNKFIARDLTIINTSDQDKHQAVALRVTSNAAFYRCQMISYQDTLYVHSLRQFYKECTIQGTIDFIFGNAAAIFQNCLILARKPNPGQSNMITAQGREDPNQNTGISLQNCTIKAAPEFSLADRKNFSTFLGRPWRNFSRTIVMRSYLDDLIHPKGWSTWNEYSRLDTVEYIEYMNSGPGSDTRRRVSWAGYRKNCTDEIVRQFTVGAFLRGSDGWLRSTVFPMLGGGRL